MGRKRYNQDAKDHAMGALMASAVYDDGDWKADLSGVAAKTGISISTLHRWWGERDRREDSRLREVATRGTAASAENGARSWLDSVWKGLAKGVDVIVADLEKPRETGVDDKGRGWEIGPNVAQRAAAIKTINELAEAIDAKANATGAQTAKIGDAERRLKDAIRRGGFKRR